MKANQRKWCWGGVISQAWCCLGHANLCGQYRWSSAELVALWLREMVWSSLGMLVGTWPRGLLRSCAENGASQALVGLAVLAARHLASIWQGRSPWHGVG